jgi:predicted nucleic acid-binding Zn ribbon protein
MIYGYVCDECGRSCERHCSLAVYEADPHVFCPDCEVHMRQILYSVRGIVKHGFDTFRSPVDGTLISSARDLAEHNKRNNVVNIHDGYDEKAVSDMIKKDYQAPLDGERKKDLRQDLEKSIAQCVDGYKPTVAREDTPP